MAKLTTEEKRREALKRQLFGKEVSLQEKPSVNLKEHLSSSQYSGTPTKNDNHTTSKSYLKSDLLKILILAALAIGIQLLLYWLINHNLIKLPFIG